MYDLVCRQAGIAAWLPEVFLCFKKNYKERNRENAKGGVDEFTLEKKSHVHIWTQLKVGWNNKTAKVQEAVTENHLAAWILSSQWWFQSFVWKPFKVSPNPWAWKGDRKHYPHFDALIATRRQDSLNRRTKVDWRKNTFILIKSFAC